MALAAMASSPSSFMNCRRFSSGGGRILGKRSLLRRARAVTFCSAASTDESTILELPCLPFTSAEVLVPSSMKSLHLYEARFLALLEEVPSISRKIWKCFHVFVIFLQAVRNCRNLFVHVVIEKAGYSQNEYAVRYGCLSHIQSVKRLEVGALVTIRGLGRVRMLSMPQIEPFMRGVVMPLRDEVPQDMELVSSSVQALRKAIAGVQELQIKLKTSGNDKLQTPLEGALEWAERTKYADILDKFIPGLEERVSFAALQPITGATPGELRTLLRQRLEAMEFIDTQQRLSSSIKYVEESRSFVAAKLALQSLQL